MSVTHADRKKVVLETSLLVDPPSSSEQAIDDNEADDEEQESQRVLRESRLSHSAMAWHSRPTVGVMCFGIFLYFMSESMGLSSFILLLYQAVCRSVYASDPEAQNCFSDHVQTEISDVSMFMNMIAGALSCIAAGKIGELSDRIGRKKVLIAVSAINVVVRFMDVYLLAPSTPLSKPGLILRSIVSGAYGGNVVMLSLSSSYITDIVDPKTRTRALGFIMGAFYAAMALGPLVGSYIVRKTSDPLMALWGCGLFSVLFFLLLTFGLVESRPKLLRSRSQSMHLIRKASFSSQASGRSTNLLTQSSDSIASVFAPLKLLWLPRHKVLGMDPRFNVVVLVFMECCIFFASVSSGGPAVLYCTANFNLSAEQLGYYISLMGVCRTIVMYGVTPAFLYLLKNQFQHRTHAPDMIDFVMILFGTTNDLLTPLIIWQSRSISWLFVSAIFGSLSAMVTPTIQSTIIKYYSESKSGEVFGAIALLKNIIATFGPAFALFVYGHTVSFYPTLVFLLIAGVVASSGMVSLTLKMHDDCHLHGFMKPRSDSVSEVGSDSESVVSIPASPMRVYDAVRRGSAGGATPRDPVSF